MLDLLIHVTAANKLSPAAHLLQVTDEDGRVLPQKPSTPIGKAPLASRDPACFSPFALLLKRRINSGALCFNQELIFATFLVHIYANRKSPLR